MGDPCSGLTARAFGAVRCDTNDLAEAQGREQIAQPGGAAAGRGSVDRLNAETADNPANELTVAVLADQSMDGCQAVNREAAHEHWQGWHQRQELMPEGENGRSAGDLRPHMF